MSWGSWFSMVGESMVSCKSISSIMSDDETISGSSDMLFLRADRPSLVRETSGGSRDKEA